MIDAATALAFSLYENKGVYALLLGSGVSRAAAIPTGWEITLDLARRVGRLEGAPDQADWAAWHQTRFGEPPNYAKLLDAVSTTPDERRAILHSYIAPTVEEHADGLKTPTRAHRALAKLIRDGFIRVVITTNFDRLLETALRELGVEPTVIKSDDDLQGAVPLIHSPCTILKVHGDYLDTRLRNTEGELAGYSKAQDQCLDRILDEHGLIVCGWSADWDQALRAAIARAPARRYPLFWASRGAPSPIAADLIAQRAGKVVPIDGADGFFEGLQGQVEVQALLQRSRPETVQGLIAAVKRHLSRPPAAIPIADLVVDEFADLKRALERPELDVQLRPISTETLKPRVAIYDTASERLIHLAFQLGRWGDGSDTVPMRDLLESIRTLRGDGGLGKWLDMQTYPGVLVFFAYGLGLLKADRLAELRTWLRLPFDRPYRQSSHEAVELFFLRWEGGDKDLWSLLDPDTRHISPFAGHVFDVITAALGPQFPSPLDFRLTYAAFELLAATTLVETRVPREELQARLQGGGRGDYVFVPLGPSGWDEDNHELMLRRFKEDAPRAKLLAAGFAGGDSDYLVLHTRNLQANMAYWRY